MFPLLVFISFKTPCYTIQRGHTCCCRGSHTIVDALLLSMPRSSWLARTGCESIISSSVWVVLYIAAHDTSTRLKESSPFPPTPPSDTNKTQSDGVCILDRVSVELPGVRQWWSLRHVTV